MKLNIDLHELIEFGENLTDKSRFESYCKVATAEIAKVLLRLMKKNTPVETSELLNGWDNESQIVVTKKSNGFEVILVNKTEYALSVNDGHISMNQYGGPYRVRNRVKVPTPYQWQKGNTRYYVFGHFFVERSILTLENSKQLESIINKQLQKWWKEL